MAVNVKYPIGTPSYLIEVLKRDDFYLPDLDCIESMQSGLNIRESYLQNPIALLYKTGYITIKGYDDESLVYTLGLPPVSLKPSCRFIPVSKKKYTADCSPKCVLLSSMAKRRSSCNY